MEDHTRDGGSRRGGGDVSDAAAGAESSWFLVSADALPEAWRDRAVPVFLIKLRDDDVRRLAQPDQSVGGSLEEDERSVARLMSRGVPPRQIALELHLSRRSVFRRLARMRQLTGSMNNAELATKLAKMDI